MKKNKLLYPGALIALAVTLGLIVSVRSWFPKVMGIPCLRKLYPDSSACDEVFWRVDYINTQKDILYEKVLIDGYAFSLAEDHADRSAELFLISDKASYGIELKPLQYNQICQTGERMNNYETYTKRFSARDIEVTDRFGYASEFSTLNLPNGTYELCFGTEENADIRGFTKTGMFFVKNNRNFYLVPSEDVVPENFDVDQAITDGVNGEIEHAQLLADGSALIEGTIQVDGYAEDEGKVLLEVSDAHGTRIIFDPDQHLSRAEILETSVIHHLDGYCSVIPATAGFSGEVIIRVFIQMPDGRLFLTPSDRSLLL